MRTKSSMSACLAVWLLSCADTSRGAMTEGGGNGDGGTDDDGGPTDAGPGALPWDPSVYGAIPEGAVYIFAPPYVTVSEGSPSRVIAVVNAASPGTRDMTFPVGQQPIWHASGGLNGLSYAEFDGVDDLGIADGFSFSQQNGTNEVAMQIVGRYRALSEKYGASGVVVSATANRDHFMRTFAIWTASTFDFYRTNGLTVGFSHNIDYLTPEASSDSAWQLHEGYAIGSGLIAFRNGTQYGEGGGGGGLITTAAAPIDEIRIGGAFVDTDSAPIDVHEVVITEGRPLSQLAAYRTIRVSPRYGIAMP